MTSSATPAQPSRSGQRFVFECPLRWSDMDAYGHLNNASFLTLYEEARVALMFVGGRACGLDSFADGVVIARHEVDYLRPVDYDTAVDEAPPKVRIEMWARDIRASRFTIAYELFDRDTVASRALSVLVPYDLSSGRPRRLAARERAFLDAYALPEASAPGGAVGAAHGGAGLADGDRR